MSPARLLLLSAKQLFVVAWYTELFFCNFPRLNVFLSNLFWTFSVHLSICSFESLSKLFDYRETFQQSLKLNLIWQEKIIIFKSQFYSDPTVGRYFLKTCFLLVKIITLDFCFNSSNCETPFWYILSIFLLFTGLWKQNIIRCQWVTKKKLTKLSFVTLNWCAELFIYFIPVALFFLRVSLISSAF